MPQNNEKTQLDNQRIKAAKLKRARKQVRNIKNEAKKER